MVMDMNTWSRLTEVRRYMERRNIDAAQAVEELVNAGLSHMRDEDEVEEWVWKDEANDR
jgi:hypothetical protein